jgi:hypothetical protein
MALADGESPRQDGPDGDFPNSKIIAGSALAIHAAGYQPKNARYFSRPSYAHSPSAGLLM